MGHAKPDPLNEREKSELSCDGKVLSDIINGIKIHEIKIMIIIII